MALPLIPVLLGTGAVAYVAVNQKPAAPPTALKNGSVQVSGGGSAPVPATVAGGGTRPSGHFSWRTGAVTRRPVTSGSHNDGVPVTTNVNQPPWNVDPQKLDAIEAAASKAYDKLTAEAKAYAASQLSQSLGIDPPLTGNESWPELSQKVGGALGAAAGAYLGGPIGAKLGAICGAYLGVKLEDLLAKPLDQLQSWLSDQWGSAEQYVEDAASDAGDAISSAASDAYDDASNYVSSIF